MKKHLLLLFSCCCYFGLQAQSLDRYVIGSAGAEDNAAGYNLEWTLGEVAVENTFYDQGQISEGFHQPILKILPALPPTISAPMDQRFQVFPNPTKLSVNVKAALAPEEQIYLQLFDVQGNCLMHNRTDGGLLSEVLSLQASPAGIYHLIIRDKAGQLLYATRIAKQ